jgi:hypothetical protein
LAGHQFAVRLTLSGDGTTGSDADLAQKKAAAMSHGYGKFENREASMSNQTLKNCRENSIN